MTTFICRINRLPLKSGFYSPLRCAAFREGAKSDDERRTEREQKERREGQGVRQQEGGGEREGQRKRRVIQYEEREEREGGWGEG